MPEVSAVRELHGSRMGRLDHCAAGLRRVLLRWRVYVPFGRPHERVQSRGRADADLNGLQVRAPGVLRADEVTTAGVALHGQRYEDRFKKLPRHDRRRMWL